MDINQKWGFSEQVALLHCQEIIKTNLETQTKYTNNRHYRNIQFQIDLFLLSLFYCLRISGDIHF